MYPTSSLQPGATGDAVKQLQNYLVSTGYMTQAQVNTGYGIYGPQTTAAVAKLQSQMGIDTAGYPGYWGPKTVSAIQKVTGTPAPTPAVPLTVNQQVAQAKAMLEQTQKEGDKPFTGSSYDTQKQTITKDTVLPDDQLEALKKAYADALAQSEKTAALAQTNNAEAILNAYLTGDWSGVTDATGQPFSLADQQDALAKSQAALAPYYEAQQTKAEEDAKSSLLQQQQDFQNYLDQAAASFVKDKTTLDQTAADQGVLFAGARAQKEQQLSDLYKSNLEAKRQTAATNIGNAARTYQYQYGDTAAGKLSDYYTLGNQGYNANVAQNNVTPAGISSVYNSGGMGFQGTQVNAALAAAQQRAAGLLKNKANKLLATGYQNQL